MDEQAVIQLLRHYRHDLVNQLQIVQGYVSMQKTEKAQLKLTDYMVQLKEEGKLINLNTPLLALFILQFNLLHTNFRLTYHIDTEKKDLQAVDQRLESHCKQVINMIEEISDGMTLYELTIQIQDVSSDMIELELAVNGQLPNVRSLMREIDNLGQDFTVYQKEEGITCSIRVPYK